ncbi:hypothetical protein BDF22DRAFT_229717 [Syncephalis plumigaleata]|nr:hypothetical protein BDF22DRAFT_229717 [Syncephalis plumigaleata]
MRHLLLNVGWTDQVRLDRLSCVSRCYHQLRGVAVTYLIWSIWSYHRGGEGQPMSVRSSTIDVDAFADEDECEDDFAYDNRMMDHFSQHMESMHLATGLDSQHAELIREHQNESYTSGSTGTCVSMTIANNHPLVTLTGRHQYTHEGTIEMEPTDSIDHGKTQEYRATNRGAKDTAAVVVYEVKSTHHSASVPSRPYHRLFLAVACRNKIEKQRSASTKYTTESIEERADMANIHETCVFLFRSDSPNFPEYDLLLKRFYERYAVHLLAPISDDDTTSWIYLLDNDTSFVVQFSQIQNGNSATTRVSIEETSKEYTDNNNNNNNNRSVSSFPNQILMLGPVLDIPLSGFSWHCSNAFIEIAKEIEATMSWKPSQAIQLIENATDRLELTIVPIWSSDHFELLSNDTNSSKPLPQNKYEICQVNTTNSSANKCLAIYHLSNVSTTASLMDDPLDGTIMIVHHHNYLTALTVISVNNIQRDQLINHVVPSLENKGIVNYFGSMIPAYRYISLDESTRMCIKAFRAHPESNDKEHITKPAVITVSVIDQLHEEYNKAEVNTSVVNNSIQPLFRIHHDIEHEGFSLEHPSEWCIGYTREKSNEESNNASILLEDADIIQHVRNTSDSMEEGIIPWNICYFIMTVHQMRIIRYRYSRVFIHKDHPGPSSMSTCNGSKASI